MDTMEYDRLKTILLTRSRTQKGEIVFEGPLQPPQTRNFPMDETMDMAFFPPLPHSAAFVRGKSFVLLCDDKKRKIQKKVYIHTQKIKWRVYIFAYTGAFADERQ